MKHYHVLGGMHGCMPNINEAHETLEDAQLDYGWCIDQETDASFNNEDGVTINHLNWDGALWYAEVENGGNEYYEITECDFAECLETIEV